MKKVTAMTCVLFAGAGLFISQVANAEQRAGASQPEIEHSEVLSVAENGLERFQDFIRPEGDDEQGAHTANS